MVATATHKITEKRTVAIPPCRIEKALIREIGELLEKDDLCKDNVNYILDSKTRDIQSKRVKDFIEADWGSNIRNISIATSYLEKPEVRITIDFEHYFLSEFSVSGENATWVNGLSDQIGDTFRKYNQNITKVRTNPLIKVPLIIVISSVLVYPLLLAFSPFIKPDRLLEYYVLVGFILSAVFFVAINALINWLFPYYEYGQTLQKSARKWIWFVLFGSGIIPAIILRYLGF